MKVYKRKYKNTQGEVRECKTWWVLATVNGKRIHESLRVRDKRAADLIAAERIRKLELEAAGIVDPFGEARARPLKDHVEDFLKTMKGRGVVPAYIKSRRRCIHAFIKHAGAERLDDCTLTSGSAFLSSIEATGVSARRRNTYYQALRQFGIWLVKTRCAQFDPFDGLKPLNEEADRRHVRRALTPQEAEALLKAARERPLAQATAQRIHAGVTPRERLRLTRMGKSRELVYLMALSTGLRAGELKALRWADIDFEKCLLTVQAASSKSRRTQTVKLRESTRDRLREAMPPGADPMELVMPKKGFPSSRTFHLDREHAGIVRRDPQGRVIDFHALRTTFISWLAVGGVHPRVAQALARHASIETTMARYTDLTLMDVEGAVESLPLPGGATKKKAGRPITPRWTGTTRS